MESTPIYSLRAAKVYEALETSPAGLSPEEVDSRRSLYGANQLVAAPHPSSWRQMLAHITHPMALLLWVAGLLAFLIQEPALGVIIWGVVLVNAALSFWREYRAEQAMDALSKMLPDYARLVRGGVEVQTLASDIVPGDILVLAEGDHIPADARVVEEYGLRTNNSVLTGEAVPARKAADASLRVEISELERPNLIFAGTSVVSGTGRAVVYATGMLTQFGRIARLTQTVREEPSPLQQEMVRITRIISGVAFLLGLIVFFVVTFDERLSRIESLPLALGIIVAAIPEGLPATITLSLAIAGQRLAQRGVLVKKLSIIETLGTISLVCTDKSGTLTQNQMTVREVWVARQRMSVSGAGYAPEGDYKPDPSGAPHEEDLRSLLTAATLCNNSRLNPPTSEKPQWTSLGDQTEAALRVAARKGGVLEEDASRRYPRVHELPFDARRKRMSTIHRQHGAEIAFVKGAPREVLALCSTILVHGKVCPLDEAIRQEILSAIDDYAQNALRVLALARREIHREPRMPGEPGSGRQYSPERIENDLTFLGLMAMMDPPRPEVEKAVSTLRQAGIRIVMITGDYGLTASSMAQRVGILRDRNPRIITGAELDTLSDFELNEYIKDEVIFARMAPEHKLRLVSIFQARGEVVAVTGDGVNDAPALRKADVGVAMGLSGTDVAREAADVVLINDKFSSIVSAIEEGRGFYDNVRKFITYIFSSNVPEILPFLLTATFYHLPLALTVRQILAIDLGTELFPALALGMEKPEPDVMRRPPRKRSQPLVDRGLLARAFLWLGLIETVLCYSGFFLVYFLAGYPDLLDLPRADWLPSGIQLLTSEGMVYILATTVFHAGVVMSQVGNAFACRTARLRGREVGWLSNRYLLAGVAIEIILISILIYLPPFQALFQHRPIPAPYWIWIGTFPFILYTLEWLRKTLVRKISPNNGNQGLIRNGSAH